MFHCIRGNKGNYRSGASRNQRLVWPGFRGIKIQWNCSGTKEASLAMLFRASTSNMVHDTHGLCFKWPHKYISSVSLVNWVLVWRASPSCNQISLSWLVFEEDFSDIVAKFKCHVWNVIYGLRTVLIRAINYSAV